MCYKPQCPNLKTKSLFYVPMVILKKVDVYQRGENQK